MGLVLAAGMLLGVLAGSSDRLEYALACALGLSAFAVILGPPARPFLIAALVGCALGAVAGVIRAPALAPPYVGPERVAVRATLISDPKTSTTGRYASVRWIDETGARRTSVAFLPPAPPTGRGDLLELSAAPRGRYADELAVDALRVVAPANRVELTRRRVRSALTETTARHVPGSPGALTLGLLIGDDSGITSAEREALTAAGLTHITAVSGWNVMLVISLVGGLFFAIGLRGIAWTAAQMVALAGYVWIVGPDPPVLRAALMAVIAMVGIRLGRPRHALTLLALSAAVMAAVSPAIVESLSFQLSVLATLGVTLATRWTCAWQGWRAWILTPAVTTCVVGWLTNPLLALRFGTLSLAMLPANVVAAPLVVVGTIGGLLVSVTQWFPPLADAIGAATWMSGFGLLLIADAFASVPASQWEFVPPSGALIAAIYTALAGVVLAMTPEGRALGRRLTHWATLEPVSAGAAGVASVCALIGGLLVL